MGKSDNMIKFEEALNNDPEKQKAYEAALKRIAEEKSAKSDCEAIQMAVKEMGYDISIGELERAFADKQEMADDELDKVAGGGNPCWFVDGCYYAILHRKKVDEEQACYKEYCCELSYETDTMCDENYHNFRN